MNSIRAFIQKHIPRWEDALFVITLAYFVLQVCFYATNIAPGIAPDEIDHIERIHLYSKYGGLIIKDSPDTYRLGPISTFPFFYHLLLSKLLTLNISGLSTILYLRIINIIISICTVIFGYKLLCLVTKNKITGLLGIIVLTNVPMFSFLSAFVNHDNLVNLFAVMAFYYLFAYIRTNNVRYLLISCVCCLLGTLTKVTFIPLLIPLFGVYVIDTAKNRKNDSSKARASTLDNRFSFIAVTGVIMLLVILNCRLYGVNIYRYGHIRPSCTKVLTRQQCLEKQNFRVYAQLREQAKKIDQSQMLKIHDYFFHWKNMIARGVFGIFGHKMMFRNSTELLPYNILILLFLFSLIRHFKFSDNALMTYSLFSSLVYIAIIFYRANYKTYLGTAFIPAGLQGRNLFPVIVPSIALFCYYLLHFIKRIPRAILFLVITVIFVWGDMPYFVRHADKSWYISARNQKTVPAAIDQQNGAVNKSSPSL